MKNVKVMLASVVLVVLVLLDQLTKYWAKIKLEGKSPFSLVKNVLEFRYLEGGNTGAAFGIFEGKTIALGIFSLVVSLVLLGVACFMSKKESNRWYCWCIVIMAAGAIGNCMDRLLNQYVVDFIYFKPINFPIFNVADCYVTLSAITLFLLILFTKEEKAKEEKVEVDG